ncbi:Outer membrane protein W precursor [Agrobacterium rosae]|uniref:Outer membrane protein W n=1 Tax=Agrobacterium rosae TaxID=1972867 RepID=A0A1R3U212_9HYPH|nr:Outer membrane protein W precursor [Agrobacterium rosae]
MPRTLFGLKVCLLKLNKPLAMMIYKKFTRGRRLSEISVVNRKAYLPERSFGGSVLLAAVTLLCMSVAMPVLADDFDTVRGFEPGDVMIRGRVTDIVPYNVKSSIDLIGGRVDLPPMILPDVDVSVFLSEHWSITGQTGVLNTKIKLKDTLYGDIDVGTVWSLPLSLAVQYHVETQGRFRPYVGAGMIATWYFGEKPAGGFVQDFSVSSSYAPLLKAGVDYQLSDRWFANFEVKRIFPPTQTIENQGVRAKTSLDTIATGIGVGYRF